MASDRDARPGGPLGLAQRARERLNLAIRPVAMAIGTVGLVALAACGVLAALPPERWPEGLERGHLPVWSMTSLVVASLLGWGCMQLGLARVRAAIGWRVGGWLLVLLPMGCALCGLLDGRVLDLAADPRTAALRPFVRLYPPCVVAVALLAFVAAPARSSADGGLPRRAGSLLLVAPYALLLAVLAFGLEAPWLQGPLRETLEDLGAGAIVLQVALAFFVGGASAS